jgi:hypothetical protein
MVGQSSRSSRRSAHERPTEDAPILGANIEPHQGHQEAVDTTESNDKQKGSSSAGAAAVQGTLRWVQHVPCLFRLWQPVANGRLQGLVEFT